MFSTMVKLPLRYSEATVKYLMRRSLKSFFGSGETDCRFRRGKRVTRALMKTYCPATIMKFNVSTLKHISRCCAGQLAARRDESSNRVTMEKNVSTCQSCPYNPLRHM